MFFRVVDGQGEADLERPVPRLLDQLGVHCLHGKFWKAEVGGHLGAPRELCGAHPAVTTAGALTWTGGHVEESTTTPKAGGAGVPP